MRRANLVSHNHYFSITKAVHVLIRFVLLLVLEPNYLDHVVDLCILSDLFFKIRFFYHLADNLFVRRLPNIEQFPAQWEHAVEVSADNTKACNCQRLGRISLGQNERASTGIPGARIVGILQLCNSLENDLPLKNC
jgi:hypothetical protein